MAFTSAGLTTWIWNNNLKSAFLLASYPVLMLFLTWMFFAGLELAHPTGADPIQAGLRGVLEYGVYVIAAVFVWFSIAFAAHQGMINAATGATPLSRTQAPEIYNLLENLCISRGITMPKLYIIESPALNAYASGLTQQSYSVTLTRGIIEALDKDELEAVIAHELTHIMNRDVRLLVISIIFVGMLSVLCQLSFRMLLNSNRVRANYHRNHDRGGGAMLLLIATAILGIGYCLSLLIRFTLSRKREFLADAGAVELTKNPSAMISALQKISGNADLRAPDEVKQMFIENSHNFLGMFATHPPIPERIAALKMMGGMEREANAAEVSGPWVKRSGPWA